MEFTNHTQREEERAEAGPRRQPATLRLGEEVLLGGIGEVGWRRHTYPREVNKL